GRADPGAAAAARRGEAVLVPARRLVAAGPAPTGAEMAAPGGGVGPVQRDDAVREARPLPRLLGAEPGNRREVTSTLRPLACYTHQGAAGPPCRHFRHQPWPRAFEVPHAPTIRLLSVARPGPAGVRLPALRPGNGGRPQGVALDVLRLRRLPRPVAPRPGPR